MPVGIYPRTKEHCEKISESHKGKKHPLWGKHHSKETREKMSKAHKGHTHGFQKNYTPWNKDKSIQTNTGRTHFKKGHQFWLGKKRPNMSGKNHPKWKGGIKKSSCGYWEILKPDHPRANKQGYIKRGHLILEKKIGRFLLSYEFPHHINGIKTDDRPKNLEVTNRSKHMKTHNPVQYR